MANWLSNLLGGSNATQTAATAIESAPVATATPVEEAEAPAGKKMIRLRFGRINSKQLKEMAQETLKSGGMELPDAPAVPKKDDKDKDDKRDGQKGGSSGSGLSGVFNNAAQAAASSRFKKRMPSGPKP